MSDDDIARVECPTGCDYQHQEHVHLEHTDGCAQVWGIVDGAPSLLDPFDLQRTAIKLVPSVAWKKRRRRWPS